MEQVQSQDAKQATIDQGQRQYTGTAHPVPRQAEKVAHGAEDDGSAEIVGNVQPVELVLPLGCRGEAIPQLLRLLRLNSNVFRFLEELFLGDFHTCAFLIVAPVATSWD